MSTHATVQHVELKQHRLHFGCIYRQGHRVLAGAHQPKQKCYFSTMLHVTHVLQKNTNLTHPGWKIASPARMRRYASSPITGSAAQRRWVVVLEVSMDVILRIQSFDSVVGETACQINHDRCSLSRALPPFPVKCCAMLKTLSLWH